MYLLLAHANTQEASASWVSGVAMSQRSKMGIQSDSCTKLALIVPTLRRGWSRGSPGQHSFISPGICVLTAVSGSGEVKLLLYLRWWPGISLAPLGMGGVVPAWTQI